MFLSINLLPETLDDKKRSHGSLGMSFQNYIQLLKSKNFMIYTMSVTFFYVAVYAFITGSSDIYIDYFKIKPEVYSLLFGVNILGVSIMSMVNRKLVSHFDITRLLAISTVLAFIFSVILTIMGTTHSFGLWGIVIPMFFVFSMNGIIAACANAAALNTVSDEMAGSAAALLGALQYGSGIIPSILLAIFSDKTAATMTVIIAVAIFLSAVMGWLGQNKKIENDD